MIKMSFREKFLQFWRSEDEKIALIRDILVAVTAVLVVLLLLWTYTGQWFAAPMVAIESGSMQHPNEPFGRYGTIDAGDMVLVKKVYNRNDIITHGGDFGGAKAEDGLKTYGDYGDVIIYRRMGRYDEDQIIHRAMCWVDVEVVDGKKLFTIEEYGIYRERTITIPELKINGLIPDWSHSGFLTKGDNNEYIDQDPRAQICKEPVKLSWISGKARFEIPWIGTINLFFDDLIHGSNNVGNVPSDCLICLGIVIATMISIPVVLDLYDYLKQNKRQRQM
ncbi:MAG: S26 family signal peptidase [Thermoplasmata archaeon]|nr:MAG: S26 family signal peptidase [Thermoplasmata archaeon]